MVIKQVRTVSLWDKEAIVPLLAGIRIAEGSAEYDEVATQSMASPSKEHCAIGLPMFSPSVPSTASESQCSLCQVTFASREEQVGHYRLDWHRCNLQRSLAGKPPLSEEQFLQDMSDVSSLSGSDDDEEEEGEEGKESPDEDVSNSVLRKQARMFFCNADGNVISVYRAILFNKKKEMYGEQDVLQRVLAAPRRVNVAVILLGGGHFAAAVFKGSEVIIHKTFHNYTVRAKQGGSQSAKDGQSGTSHPKSSGASLRRYNELSQQQHIQELMESWKTHLERCDLIFFHAKKHNRKTLFTGKKPILNPKDDRLRTIPFPTKRAKFSEVKRVYGMLFEVLIHGTEDEFKTMVKESLIGEVKPVTKKKKEASPKKETSPRKEAKKPKSERRNEVPEPCSSSSESLVDDEDDMVMTMTKMSFCMRDIGGGKDCSFDPKTLRKLERKEREQPRKSKEGSKHKEVVWNEIYTSCRTGNKERLEIALKFSSPSSHKGNAQNKALMNSLQNVQIPTDLSLITFGKKDRTMLHIAAESGHKDILWYLLEHGCDPAASDNKGSFPFNLSKDKETRNTFRRFMAQHPKKYDYKQARIPSPLTAEQEAKEQAKEIEKKKAQEKAREEKERERKQKEEEARREREEKKRFLKLSDREKRALAAEKRFLQQQQSTGAVPSIPKQRCFMCGKDITGMVPFEYNDFKFCTTKCVREHRTKQ